MTTPKQEDPVWSRISEADADIPRMPRGHPQNTARAMLYLLVLAGVPPLEAKRRALEIIL